MSLVLAHALADRLAALGMRECVICAGARNASLVAVLTSAPHLRLWSFPEERSAAFFALGRAIASGRPVPVITTSGTAAAELLPAVIEAHYQAVPLWAVTADRPRRFRGSGAPQAIEQAGLFGPYAPTLDLETADDPATAIVPDPSRPVHWNVCLEEPSAAELRHIPPLHLPAVPIPPPDRAPTAPIDAFLTDKSGLIVLVGSLPEAEQAAAAAFLLRLGCPVDAEATSGLREHPGLAPLLVRGGDRALAALPIGRVLRLGGVPTCRLWRDLESRPEIPVLNLTHARYSGLARPSQTFIGYPDWHALDTGPPATLRPARALNESVFASHPRSEPSLIRALSRRIPVGSTLFLGNSLPIREWNTFAHPADRGYRCFANRGANGIDGTLSTWLGVSTDAPESWAIVGDLTALYDLAAPWILPQLPPARRRLVIVNNGGGKIFRQLPALNRSFSDAQWQAMENTHTLQFRGWAEMWGLPWQRIQSPEELRSLPDSPGTVIEIVPDPVQTEAFWQHWATLDLSPA